MKIAFSTLGCPGWSWDEIFATAKDLRLDGVEIRGITNEMYAPRIGLFSEQNAPKTLERLRKAGLELPMLTSGACLGFGDGRNFLQEGKDYLLLAKRLGTPYVRVMISPYPDPRPQDDVVQARTLYGQLCDYAASLGGVRALIETSGTLADSRVLCKFMQGIDPKAGGVLWDLHHPYRYFGETPAETLEQIGDWVQYLHVKDSVMRDGKASYRMMGYGDVPVTDAVGLLAQRGYDGYISLEWAKRWNPDLQEPGIVFAHFASYMGFLKEQLK